MAVLKPAVEYTSIVAEKGALVKGLWRGWEGGVLKKLGKVIVGGNDFLNKGVSDDVGVGEITEGNTVNVF